MKTLTETTISAPERGALWLDEMKPGWYMDIDLDDFDMQWGNQCVCGHVFWDKAKHADDGRRISDGYDYAQDMLGLERCCDYGFAVYPQPYDPSVDEKYEALEAEWRRIIAERQEAAS